MGLAASQARLLTLTSRMNDLEAQCMSFTSQKLLMAMKQSDRVSQYNAEMDLANEIQGVSSVQTYSKEDGNLSCAILESKGYTFDVSNNYKEVVEGGATEKTLTNVSASSLVGKTVKEYGPVKEYEKKWVPGTDGKSPKAIADTQYYAEAMANGARFLNGVAKTVNTANGPKDVSKMTVSQAEQWLRDLGIIGDRVNNDPSNPEVKLLKDINIDKTQATTSGFGGDSAHNTGSYTASEGQTIKLLDLLRALQGGKAIAIGVARFDGSYNFDEDTTIVNFDYGKLAQLVDPEVNVGLTGEAGTAGHYEDTDVVKTYEWVKVDTTGEDTYGEITQEGRNLLEEIKNDTAKFLSEWQKGNVIVSYQGQQIKYEDMGSVTYNSNPYGYNVMDYTARNQAKEAVQNKYDTDMRQLETDEKRIDMLAKQADTQYQACCTEYESVKSLIEKNVDRGFNLFG